MRIETDAGLRICRINSVRDRWRLLGRSHHGHGRSQRSRTQDRDSADGRTVDGVAVSTGNPHFVIVVDNPDFSVAGAAWQEIGAEICVHPDFPHQTNVEFVRIVSPAEIEIRIFERGVGPTTSSGTGTSASATAAIAFHGCKSPLRVVAPGGAQTVSWDGPGS